jgi:hypothetical protein
MKKIVVSLIFCLSSLNLYATEILQQFKDPSFQGGSAWTNQYLAVYQTEQTNKANIANQQAASASVAAANAANTPMAKFINLFTSQVYAQLATQLSNNLFSTCTTSSGAAIPGCTPNQFSGTMVIDPNSGSSLTWKKLDANGNPVTTAAQTATQVQLNVSGSGTTTTITVPIASFAF